jgi:hypothetical protein
MGRNMLHEERLEVAEDIEDSGLKLGCGNVQGLGRRLEVMVGDAGRMSEVVRAVREAEDDDSHHTAGVAVAGRDVRIDGTWRRVKHSSDPSKVDVHKFITIT